MRNAFLVGTHIIDVFRSDRGWCVALDGVLLRGWHSSVADAWASGIREADRADRDAAPGPGRLLGDAA